MAIAGCTVDDREVWDMTCLQSPCPLWIFRLPGACTLSIMGRVGMFSSGAVWRVLLLCLGIWVPVGCHTLYF